MSELGEMASQRDMPRVVDTLLGQPKGWGTMPRCFSPNSRYSISTAPTCQETKSSIPTEATDYHPVGLLVLVGRGLFAPTAANASKAIKKRPLRINEVFFMV